MILGTVLVLLATAVPLRGIRRSRSLRPTAVDPCHALPSCGACVEDARCGWCSSSGRCASGTPFGARSAATCAESSWSFSFCTGDACAAYADCHGCVADPFCGWCVNDDEAGAPSGTGSFCVESGPRDRPLFDGGLSLFDDDGDNDVERDGSGSALRSRASSPPPPPWHRGDGSAEDEEDDARKGKTCARYVRGPSPQGLAVGRAQLLGARHRAYIGRLCAGGVSEALAVAPPPPALEDDAESRRRRASPPPQLLSVKPPSGVRWGGTRLTLAGHDFPAAAELVVSVGAALCLDVQRLSEHVLTCIAPPLGAAVAGESATSAAPRTLAVTVRRRRGKLELPRGENDGGRRGARVIAHRAKLLGLNTTTTTTTAPGHSYTYRALIVDRLDPIRSDGASTLASTAGGETLIIRGRGFGATSPRSSSSSSSSSSDLTR